jgi:hypothetical protein
MNNFKIWLEEKEKPSSYNDVRHFLKEILHTLNIKGDEFDTKQLKDYDKKEQETIKNQIRGNSFFTDADQNVKDQINSCLDLTNSNCTVSNIARLLSTRN